MSGYKISIILAVYNVESYIERAFQSLLGQTIGFSNLQIIFADDHSTDRSREIIQKYVQQYENVFGVYLADNSGAGGKPRNEGMHLAAGKYVMFLDPDDLYEPEACEVLYREMEQGDYSCVAGYYREINEQEEVITENVYQPVNIQPGIYKMPESLDIAIQLRSGFWAKIYRRDLIERFRIKELEGVPGQDMVFFIEYILNSRSLKYVEEPIVSYRLRDKKDKSVSFVYNSWFFNGVSKSYRRCLEIFQSRALEEKFDLLFGGALNYYIQSMIDSELGTEEIRDALAVWEWAFEHDRDNAISENEIWYAPVKRFLVQKEYDEAAHILCDMRSLRKWTVAMKEAIAWHQNQEERLDGVITEQKDWIVRIEEARDFFKGQTENIRGAYEDACEQNHTLMQEVQTLKKQNADSCAKIGEMQIRKEELLEKCEEAGMEIKKWKYKYHRLIEDKRIEKIAKKKGLDI